VLDIPRESLQEASLVLVGLEDGLAITELVLPSGGARELLVEVEAILEKLIDSEFVVAKESEVGDGAFAADQPFAFAQDTLQDSKDTLDFLLVALNGTGEFLVVEVGEPLGLAKVWALAGGLEIEPLLELALLVGISDGDLVLGVVVVDEVLHDGVGLPDDEIVATMVNEAGNATIRAEGEVSGCLLFLLAKVKVDIIELEIKLVEDEADLPEVETTFVVVEGELFAVTAADHGETMRVREKSCKGGELEKCCESD